MLLIKCPWCGAREENEFSYGGEANLVMPSDLDQITDAAWAQYLFFRKNTRGKHMEQWVHSFGCRRWFNVERDTLSYKITGVYKIGALSPEEIE